MQTINLTTPPTYRLTPNQGRATLTSRKVYRIADVVLQGYRDEALAAAASVPSDAELAATYATKAAETTAASAKSMAVRGFAPKSKALKKMWAFPGVSGHGFVTAGSVGATFDLNDTTTFALGDRSAKMTPPNTDGTYSRIAKTGLTINATGQFVRTWVKVDDITKILAGNSVALMLGDNTFANYFTADVLRPSLLTTALEKKSVIKSGQWTAIDIPWSAFTVGAGTPNRATITATALLVFGHAAGSPTVWWGGCGGVDENSLYPNGVISLTFDDTYAEAYSVARPYMDKYGYAGSLYPIQGNFGAAGCLTEAQATEMFRVNGWDFGYHASTQVAHDADLTTYTEAQLVTEFETQRAWAAQRGIAGDSFAYPLAYFNALVETVGARYFRTARTNGVSRVEVLPPFNAYRIRPILANSAATLASLSALADAVKSGKGWGVVTFHRIMASGPGANDTTTAIFQGFIDYINAQGIAVETVGQVMDRL